MHTVTVPNPCHTINGGCSHLCLLSAVDPRGYSCDCPEGMVLSSDLTNCIFQDAITTVFSLSHHGIIIVAHMHTIKVLLLYISILTMNISGSCVASGRSSCCETGCQDNSSSCYCDSICHNEDNLDCCSDVPLDCEQGTPTPSFS